MIRCLVLDASSSTSPRLRETSAALAANGKAMIWLWGSSSYWGGLHVGRG